MAVPVFVQASAGTAILTGTGTVSLTGCVAGNLLVAAIFERGLNGDFSGPSSVTNINNLAGSSGIDGVASNRGVGSGAGVSQGFIYAGRVAANGTCSFQLTVGASGNDLFIVLYEISGVATGTTAASVFENAGGQFSGEANTNTTVVDCAVVTNAADRLALNFVWIVSNQAIAAFTGQSGGTWSEAVAEFTSASGATATMQLQKAAMASAGTIDGGTATITSAAWGCVGTAIIGAAGGPTSVNVSDTGTGSDTASLPGTTPLFVQASAGTALLTGTTTVSLAGCGAGNLIIAAIVERGVSGDFVGPANPVNINRLDGVAGLTGAASNRGIGTNSQGFIYAGRAAAGGTVSFDITVGASGNDLFIVLYEFSGVVAGATVNDVFENGGVQFAGDAATNTTVLDNAVITNGSNRLALQFVWLVSNQAVGSFTGESGGDWTEAVAEFASSSGATVTMQLQKAPMAAAGTIDGGSLTVSSVGWGTLGTALIPLATGGGSLFTVSDSGSGSDNASVAGSATQIIRPDQDLATSGWVTAPLFSKVNDSLDATTITATAS